MQCASTTTGQRVNSTLENGYARECSIVTSVRDDEEVSYDIQKKVKAHIQ